jgi:hypothetical protein
MFLSIRQYPSRDRALEEVLCRHDPFHWAVEIDNKAEGYFFTFFFFFFFANLKMNEVISDE